MRRHGLSATPSAIGSLAAPSVHARSQIPRIGAHDFPPYWRYLMASNVLAGDTRPPAVRRPLTAGRIEHLRGQLTDRELEILGILAKVRLATTDQITRLVFGGAAAPTAGRLARHYLLRLRQSGLVRRFIDRSRDRKVGAPGHVHALSAAGLRLVRSSEHGIGTRQSRAYRPSDQFVAHRLAITELIVRLVEQDRAGGPKLLEFATEPACTRCYTGTAGQRLVVRPDALVRLGLLDRAEMISWFIEVDRGFESATIINGKCRAYRLYELSGQEHKRYGGFPGVMFAVPSRQRARQIARVIGRQPADAQGLFAVATDEEMLAALAQPEVTTTPSVRPPP